MWTCSNCDGQTDDDFEICWTCRIPRGGPANYHDTERVLVTSTPTLSTHDIVHYVGPVFGETVYGANFMRDFVAGVTDAQGGRSRTYEDILLRGRTAAIHALQLQAEHKDCNAVVGLSIQYEAIGDSMFMICASGTAVRVAPRDKPNGVTESSTPTS